LIAFKQRHRPLDFKNNTSKMLEFWDEIISPFSECELTQAKDKLVALSGIAKAMQKSLLGSQYLGGLWRFEPEKQLLWSIRDATQNNGKPTRRSPYYRAPSWPWVSLDGTIGILNRDNFLFRPYPEIEILEATTQPLGLDPVGQVKSASIRLRGPLITLSIRRRFSRKPYDAQHDAQVNGRWFKVSFCKPHIDEPVQHLHCLPVQKGRVIFLSYVTAK
jgi:hypothetical protein